MSFSAHYRRIRAPQQPLLKIISRITVSVLIFVIIYILFVNLSVKTLELGHNILAFKSGDESNPKYKLTDYRKAENKSANNFWASIKPSFTCPVTFLTKVGFQPSAGDTSFNGNWVCGLKTLGKLKAPAGTSKPPCIVYSFAMEGESHFEAEILQRTSCSVYLYDPMRWLIGPPLDASPSTRLHFQRLALGPEDNNEMRTLELLMELNGHRWIDILKIEINAGEYRALERMLSDFRTTPWPIGQLIVKFHVVEWKTSTSRWLIALFELLEFRGLRLFNNKMYAYSPCCAEFSFINVNHLSKYISADEDV